MFGQVSKNGSILCHCSSDKATFIALSDYKTDLKCQQNLETRKIIFPINYKIQTPRTEDSNRFTIEGQEKNLAKLPTKAALDGLADIYSKFAKEASDRLLICAVALFTVTGFRVGELLNLPEDCEVVDHRNGKDRYGLRFYKEKPGKAERRYETRWLTSTGAELAKKSIEEIREITEEFRQQAQILESDPNTVPIRGYKFGDLLTSKEVAEILGIKNSDNIGKLLTPTIKTKSNFFYSVSEVQNFLLSRRVKRLWTIDRQDGTYQKLSETLFIAPKNFFHAQRSVFPLLIEPLTVGIISDFITGKKGTKSIFEKFNIREDDGSICEVTTHSFRHWINTIAVKGGLSLETLTRWMGRDNSKDTLAYIHLTQDEKINFVKNGIKNKTIFGTISETYNALPKKVDELFLDGQIQAVHFTHLGICTHDFAVSPCKYHLNCVRGCPDYLRNKNNPEERKNLVQIKSLTQKALENTVSSDKAAEPWIRHHNETIQGINSALSIDDEF